MRKFVQKQKVDFVTCIAIGVAAGIRSVNSLHNTFTSGETFYF